MAADYISDFAARVGIDPKQARDGLAAVLQALQQAVSPETFEKVVVSIPNGPELLASAKEQGTNLWGAVAGMAGQFLGASDRSQVLAGIVTRLSELGFSTEQLQKFMAQVLDFFKQHLPPDLVAQVLGCLQGDKKAS